MKQLQIGEFKFRSHGSGVVHVYWQEEYLEFFDVGFSFNDKVSFEHVCEHWVKRALRVHELLQEMGEELPDEPVTDRRV